MAKPTLLKNDPWQSLRAMCGARDGTRVVHMQVDSNVLLLFLHIEGC